MRPDIDAVIADEDGDVADDLNTAIIAVGPKSSPLFEKGELQEALDVNFILQIGTPLLESVGRTLHKVGVPRNPLLVTEVLAQAGEESVVVQPLRMRTTKGFVFVAQAALSILQKSLCRITQYRQLLSPDIVEID